MADDFPERSDPVLVRPYITTEPGGGATRSSETWPESATIPEDGTRELPPVPDLASDLALGRDPATKSSALLRQRLIVLAGVAALALAAVAGFVAFGPEDGDEPPPTARPTLAAPSVAGSLGAAPAVSAAARSLPPSSKNSRSPAAAAAATATSARGTTPSPAGGVTPTATLLPPPGQARTGAITSAGGRCLSGYFTLDGSPVQAGLCAGGSSQRWTLASDGTLMVSEKCAQVTADGTVRIIGCDDRPSAQWRAGPHGSLINPETGRCLTDPGLAGATTEVTECTGATDQTWTLP